jgi:hypothetical protein
MRAARKHGDEATGSESIFCTPVFAHDANHPELNSWFDHLSSGNGLVFAERRPPDFTKVA